MEDAREVIQAKCEWVTAQVAQTVDKFVTITISFFIPILIAIGLAVSDPAHFEALFFVIPWLMGSFLLITAYILFSYQGLAQKNQYFERKLEELAGTDIFAFERYFNKLYFEPPLARDSESDRGSLSPLVPLLCVLGFLICALDALCMADACAMPWTAFGINHTAPATQLAAKLIFVGGTTLVTLVAPLWFLFRGAKHYQQIAARLVDGFRPPNKKDHSLQ